MGMRETEGSLRAYFLVVGVLGSIAALAGLRDASTLHMSMMFALWVPILSRAAICVGFLLAGIKLKAALPTGATWIKNLLLASIALLVLDSMLIVGVLGQELGRGALIGQLIGLGITAYLLASVRRLSAEAMARAALPTAQAR